MLTKAKGNEDLRIGHPLQLHLLEELKVLVQPLVDLYRFDFLSHKVSFHVFLNLHSGAISPIVCQPIPKLAHPVDLPLGLQFPRVFIPQVLPVVRVPSKQEQFEGSLDLSGRFIHLFVLSFTLN